MKKKEEQQMILTVMQEAFEIFSSNIT